MTANPVTFPPITDAAWPQEAKQLKDGFAGRLNVYRTMAHHPRLLNAWAPLRDHIVVKNALGAQFSEVVILRTGHQMNAPYEWAHHVSRARACGMDDARIASIAGPPEQMERDDATLSRAVDELMLNKSLTPETIATVTGLVGREGLFDVIATVGFYTTLGFIVNSFETPVDEAIQRELAERPLDRT